MKTVGCLYNNHIVEGKYILAIVSYNTISRSAQYNNNCTDIILGMLCSIILSNRNVQTRHG